MSMEIVAFLHASREKERGRLYERNEFKSQFQWILGCGFHLCIFVHERNASVVTDERKKNGCEKFKKLISMSNENDYTA